MILTYFLGAGVFTLVMISVAELNCLRTQSSTEKNIYFAYRDSLIHYVAKCVRCFVWVTARHSQGPPLPGSATPRVRYSQGPLLPGSTTPSVHHSQGPPFPGT